MRNLQERRAVVPEVAVTVRRLLSPAVAAVVVAADQLTKTVALDHLQPGLARHAIGPVNWVLTYNTGAAFGLGTGITPILETGAVLLVVGLLLFSRRAASRASTPVPVAAALGLLLGGALSNLGDRIFRHVPGHPGAVVDFIQGVSWWPVFNLADASIVVGVVLLVLTYRPRG